MVQGVFFDFWGTLVENGTYSPLRQTYKLLRVRMPFGKFAEEFEQVFMTKPYEDQKTAFQAVCDHFHIKAHADLIDRLIGIWNKNRLLAKPYDDTIDTLKALKEKGIKLAITSNAPNGAVEPVIERFEMGEYFDDILISSDVGKLKTTGLFDFAAEKLGLSKEDIIIVGDSIDTDIKGAEKAGITAYLIDRKDRREHENKIVKLSELLDKVEE